MFFRKSADDLNQAIIDSRLFDADWYSEKYRVAPQRAVSHYLKTGWREGCDPSLYFSTKWYLHTYPDIKDYCPLAHFVLHGQFEKRSTSPFFLFEALRKSLERYDEGVHPLIFYISSWKECMRPGITLLDSDYYRWMQAAALKGSSTEIFKHFMTTGSKLIADPHPLFSSSYYLEQNQDVLSAGLNPLWHYVFSGAEELRDPHPFFDSKFYVKQVSDWESQAIKNPLVHYLTTGAARGLDPSAGFDTLYYLRAHKDVRAAAINPLVHFVVHGQAEGRPTKAVVKSFATRDEALQRFGVSSALSQGGAARDWLPISVVLPTFNRVHLLRDTIEICRKNQGGVPVEYVIVDDGSTDNTPDYLAYLSDEHSDVVVIRTPNQGPGAARNLGIQAARNDIILLIGDDVRPESQDFFRAHSEFHSARPSPNEAMLGKLVWPNSNEILVNTVMKHIQGIGGEQFGYADMIPYTWYDWRFFYTSNVSFKKNVVGDWEKDGFSHDFRLYGFEDIELAYRINKKIGLSIFYDPLAIGSHIHPYSFNSFVERQLSAGSMATVFLKNHPEACLQLGLDWAKDALLIRPNSNQASSIVDLYAVFEGLRGWINFMERRGELGNAGFHDELLSAFFQLSFNLGYINSAARPEDNVDLAFSEAFKHFLQKMRRAIQHELGVTEHEVMPI